MRLRKQQGEGTALQAKGTTCAVLRGSMTLQSKGKKAGVCRREPGSAGDAAAELRPHGVSWAFISRFTARLGAVGND